METDKERKEKRPFFGSLKAGSTPSDSEANTILKERKENKQEEKTWNEEGKKKKDKRDTRKRKKKKGKQEKTKEKKTYANDLSLVAHSKQGRLLQAQKPIQFRKREKKQEKINQQKKRKKKRSFFWCLLLQAQKLRQYWREKKKKTRKINQQKKRKEKIMKGTEKTKEKRPFFGGSLEAGSTPSGSEANTILISIVGNFAFKLFLTIGITSFAILRPVP